MRFLHLVFAIFLLVSLAAPGYGRIRKSCADVQGYCSKQCARMDTWSFSSDCRNYCCVPPTWKGK